MPSSHTNQSETERRIDYYENVLSQHPGRYSVRVQLAEAYLKQVQKTLDPDWLLKARTQIHQSLKLQPTYEAFLIMARTENYAHRFESAINWGNKATAATPRETDDPLVIASLVESHLGLGQIDKAMDLLGKLRDDNPEFYGLTAKAAYLHATHQYEQAASSYLEAASLARTMKENEIAAWAEASAAGEYLDAHHPELAKQHLVIAEKLAPTNRLLLLHWGEYWEALGQFETALEVYESLLKRSSDPVVHHRAFMVARKLGQVLRMTHHLDEAEKEYQIPIDVGEFYTLGALAQLYYDADVQLDRALSLAQQNLEYKRDSEAVDIVKRLQKKFAAKE